MIELYRLWVDTLAPWVLLGCFLAVAGVALTLIYIPLQRFKTLIDHDYIFLSQIIPLMSEAVLHTEDALRRDPQLEETLSISYYETVSTINKYKKWLEIAKEYSDKHWDKRKVSMKVMVAYNEKVREVMS
jgi:hypothetical protein